MRKERLWDGLAIGASTICLVHCLALPVLFLLVPTLATFLAFPESFHMMALFFAIPTSLLALAGGYRRHRWLLPAMMVAPGLLLLALGALAAPTAWAETLLTVIGALFLAVGHALNWRALGQRAGEQQQGAQG